MQGEPSPAAVSLFVPVTLTVPLPRSVATHAQWAPLVSIVMFWAVMTPAYVASRPRDEFLVVAIVTVLAVRVPEPAANNAFDPSEAVVTVQFVTVTEDLSPTTRIAEFSP